MQRFELFISSIPVGHTIMKMEMRNETCLSSVTCRRPTIYLGDIYGCAVIRFIAT